MQELIIQKMKTRTPRVWEVIKAADAGIIGIKLYFDQEGMSVDPSTWCGQIKKSIEENHVISVLAEIELIKEKFNYYVSEEKGSDTGANPVDGE